MLEINGVKKTFGRGSVTALERVTVDIPNGQFVCLLGPSGCGKTTLLRIVAGLIAPDDGVIRVGGNLVRGPGIERSMVFQNYGLLPWRTVMGNVEFGLEIRGTGRGERRAAARKQIERLGLAGFEDHYPHQLSGGMQQRVALARCLVKESSILLMDEPFAAVDMQTREYLQDELLAIWNAVRTTVVFVTHSIEEAIYLGDRVVVMTSRPGRVTADILVDLPRPRQEGDAKATPRFGELRHQVREALGAHPADSDLPAS